MANEWQNRIVGHGERSASQFTAHPNNPRVHPQRQRDAMRGSLDSLGWIAPVIVNKRTGYLIDGHERIWQALAEGEETPVPYIEVDLSDDEEKLALASYDFITYMATYDADILGDLLGDVNTADLVVGEGLAQALAELADDYGANLEGVEFKEYDESIADDVEYITCPHCSEKFPK